MRILRSLIAFILNLIQRVTSGILAILGWLSRQIFGEVHWQSPNWLSYSGKKIESVGVWAKQNPKQSTITGLLAIALLAASYFGWQWYQKQPKPVLTAYTVTAPLAPTYDDLGRAYPSDLIITFKESVARVEALNAPIKSGVQLKPNVAGEWSWSDDKTLVFRPKNDWPIDEKFEVFMDKSKFFAPQIKLEDYQFEFKSAPFTASITSAEFYQDPIDANLKKLVSIVHFSHPVDEEKFKASVSVKLGDGLSLLGLGSESETTINFDKHKLDAFIHSSPLSIPKEDTKLTLTLKSGIKASKGGNGTPDDIVKEVNVPGLYSLQLNDISMTLVDNERFEPEQVLVIGSTMNMSEAELKGHVSAWLLPEHHPKTPADQRTQPHQWYANDVTKEIIALSEPLSLAPLPSAETYEATHSYKFNAPVGRKVYVVVDAGIKAFGGYMSQKPAIAVVNVQPYPQVAKLLSQGSLLTLSGEQKLAYVSRGLNGVKIEIGRLLPNQLHHLVQRNYAHFSTPNLYESDLNALVERSIEKRPLPSTQYGKPSYDSIDFGAYLQQKSSAKGGVFMVSVDGYNPEAPDASSSISADTRFILVTDIGIIAKKSVDGSQDVFVQSIATGDPIAGAKVEVVGLNGIGTMSAITDEQGHVKFQHLNDLKREKQALMYVVTKDDDLSFLPINRYDRNVDLSRFDIGGISNAISAQQLSAYGFTDRGIYRPGETTHIAFITRTADWKGHLEGIPLEIEVTDPRGLPVLKKAIRLNNTGLDSIDFKSNETSATGEYHVGLYVVRNNARQEEIGSTSFKVQEFEPDRLKVNVTLAETTLEGWIKPEQAQAKVQAMHLFGSPANDRRVEARMTLTPAIPAFAKFKDFSFQEMYKLKEPYAENLPEATTNANGEALLEMNLKRFARATYRLHISAKVFESGGGRGVAAESSTLVSSAPYLVGVKNDGNLNYIKRDTARISEWIAVDPNLKPIAVDNLTRVLIERKFVSVLVKQSSGTYKYESRKKEIVKESAPFRLAESNNKLSLNTDAPGDYAIAIRDAAGNELNRIEYSVAGEANISRSLERNAELQLTLNKADYKAGEPIEVSIRAPYTGSGLITIERDRVYTHQWFKTDTTSSVQTITLPKDFEGNGYVSVQFVRDAASDEIFMSPLSYGVVPFEVNLDARKEPLKVSMPEVIKPGQTLDIKVSSTSAAKAVVFAVDEGILQVARYKTPDPVGFFFQKRALEVQSTQILDLILPEFQQLMNAAAPGGDGDAVLGRHLNPFKKKRQAPVAWWSGVQEINAQTKSFQYTVPDTFNGKVKVFVVAVTPQKVGVHQGGTEVRGDLILSANVPSMVAPGDEFTVSVSVFNNIKGATGKTPVQVAAKNNAAISLISAPKVALSISPQQEATAEFTIKANRVLGSGDLQFIATYADKQGKALESVSVRPASPLATTVTVGRFDNKQQVLGLKRSLFAEHRNVTAGISASPLAWSEGLDSYLESFAYSCTEQLVSKGMPSIILASHQDASKRDASFNKVIQTLRERQNGDGSFGLWSANLQVEPWASVYATHYLLEAQARGYAVPADMLASANAWLEQMAANGSQGLDGARTRAYAIYLLTKQGKVTSGLLATLQKELDERYAKTWPEDLTAAYVASSYQLLQQDDLAKRMIENVPWRKDLATSEIESVYYDATVHDAQLLYLTAKHFKSRLNSVPKAVLNNMGEVISDNHFHTLSAAYLILGFDAYGVAGGSNNTFSIAEMNAAGALSPVTLNTGAVQYGKLSPKAAKVAYNKTGPAPAFYVLTETGFDSKPNEKASNEGLEIAKKLTGLDGKPLTQITVGQEFLVQLTFRSTGRDKVSQVAIVDLLPGGMEPVLKAVDASPNEESYAEDGYAQAPAAWLAPIGEAGNSWMPEYADVRDDRVILYGTLTRDVGTFVYRVRATNAGKFVSPAPFVEGMYNRKLQARGATSTLEVKKP